MCTISLSQSESHKQDDVYFKPHYHPEQSVK